MGWVLKINVRFDLFDDGGLGNFNVNDTKNMAEFMGNQ